MRSFECQTATSHKFWNIHLDETELKVVFGPLGSRGQTQEKSFDDPVKAQAAFDKLIREKLAKGYVETTGAKGAKPSPLQRSLEKALAADPDNLATHAAYAEELMQQGDPRGDFVQIQFDLEDTRRPAAERKKLQAKEQALLKRYARRWLGDLTPYLLDGCGCAEQLEENESYGSIGDPVEYEYRWSRGWLSSLRVPEFWMDFADVLATAPAARLLRELVIEHVSSDGERDLAAEEWKRYGSEPRQGLPALYPLLASPWLGTLRSFQLGAPPDERWHRNSYSALFRSNFRSAMPIGMVKKMTRLEELHIFIEVFNVAELFKLKSFTNLRILEIYHCYNYPLEDLARNPSLGRLTHLLLHPKAAGHWKDDLPYIKAVSVRALLHSRHLPSLQHLRLRLSDLGDSGCEEIVRSGILKRLKTLDLRHGIITDDGARLLAACPDLKNLELLDLSKNRLTKTGVNLLRKTLPGARAEHQQMESEWEDDSYLAEGDIE